VPPAASSHTSCQLHNGPIAAIAFLPAALASTPWATLDGQMPGRTLIARLEQLGISQAELARRTGLSTKHDNQVVKDAIGVSADVALLRERETGIPAAAWNRLDAAWRERQARARAEAYPKAADR